ncbi:MAG: hypothetical protein NW200_03210 [Hyphomonadaceae bacterium]|nr:hypothetical protein [Hyphomonadaceae bacterium]
MITKAALRTSASVAQLSRWYNGRTPRERALVAAIVFASALALCLQAIDILGAARTRAAEARVERERIEAMAASSSGDGVYASVDASARAARLASVGGETIHIARARAQADVEAAALGAGVSDVSVALRERPVARDVVEEIVLVVEGDYHQASFARFLAALSALETSFSPATVDASADEDAGRFRMTLQAYALPAEAGP